MSPTAGKNVTEPQSSVPRTVLDELADVLLFGPLGLLFEARNVAPKLIERGRKEVEYARTIGSFVVPMAKKRIVREFKTRQPQTSTDSVDSASETAPQPTHDDAPAATSTSAPRGSGKQSRTGSKTRTRSFPVDDYDSLPSSTIVELLNRLSDADVEAVLHYEQAQRKRRTILIKAQQRLDAGTGR